MTMINSRTLPGLAAVMLLSLVIGVLCLAGAPALAEAQTAGPFTIEINKGMLVRLKSPASAVMIADPEIADVQVISPSLVYLNGRKVGETTILAVDSHDTELLQSIVTVTHNLSSLNRTLHALMPNNSMKVDSVAGALVVNGNVDSPLEVEQVRALASPYLQKDETLVNMVKSQGSDQVTLMVKVAEVSRSELKRFGIHLESLFNTGNFIFGIANGRDFLDETNSVLRNGNDNSLLVRHTTGSSNANALIDALEDEGLVTVLAEPNLTTMSGQPANFLAGGEFPVPVVGQDGQVTIEYRPFGVSLAFTPTVISKEKINLSVAPEVSTLSQVGSVTTAGFEIPSLVTRRASTTVELGSGQSFAIAGLLQNSHSNDISKFPALGDVPILGALFRSNEFRTDQTELVILVTPFIVQGVSANQMATPVDGFVPATDVERILFGKLYHETEPGSAENRVMEYTVFGDDMPKLNGPVGYVLK